MSASVIAQPAPYAEHHIAVNGLKLRVQDYGTPGKPALLCLHGGAANAHWYDFVAQGFTADYHVRAVDLRGHGNSQWDPSPTPSYGYQQHAADVNALAETLDLSDFVLIGHSMGGMIGSIYCATYPGRAKAFVLVDTTIKFTPERIAGFNAISNREGRHYATQEEFIAAYKVHPGGSTAAPEIHRHIAQSSGRRFDDGRWRHKVDRKVYNNREMVDSFPLWNHIRIPVLLMKGERSPRIDPVTVAEVKSRAPQVEVDEVPGCDHHITLDNPAGFVAVARKFLDKIR